MQNAVLYEHCNNAEQQVSKMQVSSKVIDFVNVCKSLDKASIFVLFENLMDEDLKDEIYNVACTEAPSSLALARQAFNKLGAHYGVASLRDY